MKIRRSISFALAVCLITATMFPAPTFAASLRDVAKAKEIKSEQGDVRLNKKSVFLSVGKKSVIRALSGDGRQIRNVSWKSSNTKVAAVSGGVIYAKAPGKATITARVGNKRASCIISVRSPLTKFSITTKSVSLEPGDSKKLGYAYAPKNITESKRVSWSSLDPSIVSVNQSGVIVAKREGTTIIKAKMGNRKSLCTVTVSRMPTFTMKYNAGTFLDVSNCYTLLNECRTEAGMDPVKRDPVIEIYAKNRVQELITSFSHRRPNGGYGIAMLPYNTVRKAENIASGQTSCEKVMYSWNRSAAHRMNLLDGHFTRAGVAGFKYGGRTYWVMFLAG